MVVLRVCEGDENGLGWKVQCGRVFISSWTGFVDVAQTKNTTNKVVDLRSTYVQCAVSALRHSCVQCGWPKWGLYLPKKGLCIGKYNGKDKPELEGPRTSKGKVSHGHNYRRRRFT